MITTKTNAAAICLLALAAAACQNTRQTDSDQIANFEINETFKLAGATYLRVGDNSFGDSMAVYSQAAVSIQWPVRFGDNDLSALQDSLLLCVFGVTGTPVDQAITDYVAQPLGYGDFRLEKVDAPAPGCPALLKSVGAHTVGFCERYIVYKVTEFEDNGGAHPNYASKFLNYDIKSNSVLKRTDIFAPGSDQEVLDAVVAQLLDLYFSDSLEELEQKSGIFTDQIFLTDNIYITGSDIVFFYNPYEIAPWYVGAVEVPLHEYDLEEYLTPQAKALFWWNDQQP